MFVSGGSEKPKKYKKKPLTCDWIQITQVWTHFLGQCISPEILYTFEHALTAKPYFDFDLETDLGTSAVLVKQLETSKAGMKPSTKFQRLRLFLKGERAPAQHKQSLNRL